MVSTDAPDEVEWLLLWLFLLLLAACVFYVSTTPMSTRVPRGWNTDITLGTTGLEWSGRHVYPPMGAQAARCMPDHEFRPIDETASVDAKIKVDFCTHKEFGNEHYGITTPYTIPQVSSKCAHNALVAIRNRVVAAPDTPAKPETMENLRGFVSERLVEFFGPKWSARAVRFKTWASRYTEARQDQLKKAVASLEAGVTDWAEMLKVRAFLKRENILKTEPHEPRVISPRDDRYVAGLGPQMFGVSNYMAYQWGGHKKCNVPRDERPDFDSHDPLVHLTYASGLTREQIGDWFDQSMSYVSGFGEPVAITSDFSRFDMTIHQLLQRLEFMIEGHIIEFCALAWKFLWTQIRTVGVIRGCKQTGYVLWRCLGGRHSGDVNTSVGNTILNGVVLLHIIFRVFGVEPLTLPFRAILLGDDVYMVITKRLASELYPQMVPMYAEYGLKAKAKLLAPRDGEFCSSLFVPTRKGTVLASKPGRLLAKTFWSIHKLGVDKQQGWLKGVIASVMPGTRVWPWVYKLMLTMKSQIGADIEIWRPPTSRLYGDWWKSDGHREFDDLTAEFVKARYNITPSDIDEFCRWVDSEHIGRRSVVAHPLLYQVHRVDVLGEEISTDSHFPP